MSRNLQLQIPEPCHESWEKMTSVEQGRFCNSCQKAVVDFTGMSDAQLVSFFKKPSTGSICGRFNNDQLGREFSMPGKRMPWLRYFLQLFIPAVLVSMKAKSQGKPVLLGDTVLVDSGRKLTAETCQPNKKANGTCKITGRLVDEKGLAISSASVIIKGTRWGTLSDAEGKFSLLPIGDKGSTTLVFSAIGYASKEMTIESSKTDTMCNVDLVPLDVASTGYILITRSPKKKKKAVTIFQRMIKDTVAKFFKVYPNPALSGGIIKLEMKKAEPGEYIADLINQNGQILHTSVLQIDQDLSNTYTVPSTITGTYFLRLTHRLSGKIHVEKLIIQ